jgi:hypothetical protein
MTELQLLPLVVQFTPTGVGAAGGCGVGVRVGVRDGVGVREGVSVIVAVLVLEEVGVREAVDVFVGVFDGVEVLEGVNVRVAVGVFDGVMGVDVLVRVGLLLGVGVEVIVTMLPLEQRHDLVSGSDWMPPEKLAMKSNVTVSPFITS